MYCSFAICTALVLGSGEYGGNGVGTHISLNQTKQNQRIASTLALSFTSPLSNCVLSAQEG